MSSVNQTYGIRNRYFITPELFGSPKDPDACWVNFDWKKAAVAGMKSSGLAYSGEYGFAPTEMYWRINHMVTPAAKALGCLYFHGDKKGCLAWQKLGYKGGPMREKTCWSRKQTGKNFQALFKNVSDLRYQNNGKSCSQEYPQLAKLSN
jgi:hypothetical protein